MAPVDNFKVHVLAVEPISRGCELNILVAYEKW